MPTADASPASVLFVDQSGELGGAELSLLDLVRLRGADGDSVVLLANGPFRERLESAGIRAKTFPLEVSVQKSSGMFSQLAAAPRVLGIARRLARAARQHSLIYANTQKAAVVGALAGWLANKPMVWHLRDTLDSDHFSGINRRAVIAATNRSAQRIVANSEATAAAYSLSGGKIQTTVCYNGIDSGPFEQAADARALRIRESLGIHAVTPLIGIFGRLTPWKGQHLLLDALKETSLAAAHAIIVGEALFTKEDRNYASQLQKRSNDSALRGRVHWLGQRNDVPFLMGACDIVVHCSTAPEPFGRVIVEGMLAERPVIASNAGGAAEIIDHGRTGLLTELGSAEDLAVGIKRLLNNPAEARRMAVAGRQDALVRFNIDDRVADINAIIEEVARGR